MATSKFKANGNLIQHVVVGDKVSVTLIDGTVLKGMYVSLGITRGFAIKSLLPGMPGSWAYNKAHVKSLIKL